MANSVIPKDNSAIIKSGNIATGVNWYRKGNTVTVSVENVSITDTTDRTTFGTLPSDLCPPCAVFSRIISDVYGYIDIKTDGTVQGYRSTAGVVLGTVTFGIA